jgi:hypothetical protein
VVYVKWKDEAVTEIVVETADTEDMADKADMEEVPEEGMVEAPEDMVADRVLRQSRKEKLLM